MTPALAAWNAAPEATAREALLACCGSPRWAEALVGRRPWSMAAGLLRAAEDTWFAQPETEWLAAFACHPRIGEQKAKVEAAGAEFARASAGEQAAAQATLDGVREQLAAKNRAYVERFGFLYLVFAQGRTAPELLAILEQRLGNPREAELLEAARQQAKITARRMTEWLGLDKENAG